MGSDFYYVKTSDTKGGYGANFVVKWKSDKEVNEPIVECIMTGTRGNHSVSFISQGARGRQVIERAYEKTGGRISGI
jgi:hypothetical protein